MFCCLSSYSLQEELDLEVLAREAQEAIAFSKDAQQHNRDQNVAVIVKVPVVAMKYPMKEGQVNRSSQLPSLLTLLQVRRFQIRFASDENYYDAMKMLSRAQVPTIEAGTFPARPQTAFNAAPSKSASLAESQVDTRPYSAAARLDISQNPAASLVSPDRILDLNKRPATAISTMMPPPSHFLNPTQGNAGRAGNQQYESQPRAPIDLYTPRPSMVPAVTSQHFSQLLPARRELPFEKTDSSPHSSTPYVASTPRVLRSATKPSEEPEPTPVKQSSSSNQTKKAPVRKRASAASQNAASKKNARPAKVTKTASKGAASSAAKSRTLLQKQAELQKEETPVPSIEEVLIRKQPQAAPDSVHKSNDIDTQALLIRAEDVHNSGLRMICTKDVSPSKQPALEHPTVYSAGQSSAAPQFHPVSQVQVPVSSAPQTQAPISPLKTASATYPCTPANQTINPSTPSAPFAQHIVDAAPDPLSQESPNPLANITSAYDTLLQDPAFADPDSKLASWAALPDDQRKEALNTFICNQYLDETGGFQRLCELMTHSWETSIVWPEVYKRSI